MKADNKLAIEGGKPVRTKPFPSVNNISGRNFGEEEIMSSAAEYRFLKECYLL
ncbi:MAG: hypothetical protein N2115_02210 [bacterium]|nr:hypothetical protein [bacterium]